MTRTLRLSVVVPTCSRVRSLATLLELLAPAVQGLDAAEFEVIVSDDAPATPADTLAGRFPAVRFFPGPGLGPAANRNAGARQARGEWVVFTDDDCRPASGWLRAIAACADRQPLDVIEGKIIAPDERESIFRRDVENLDGNCFWSANLAVRREYFEQIGGFDEDFGEAGGEDMELAHRFRSSGARTTFCRDAIVVHPPHLMTWRQALSFAFRIRWHALYRLKTHQGPAVGAPLWRVVPALMFAEAARLLRNTRRALKARDGVRSNSVLAQTALSWTLFPVILPYLVYWDLRFRRLAKAK